MVERLDVGVRRLEMASEQSASGGSSELELVRQAGMDGTWEKQAEKRWEMVEKWMKIEKL